VPLGAATAPVLGHRQPERIELAATAHVFGHRSSAWAALPRVRWRCSAPRSLPDPPDVPNTRAGWDL
jgi:hypothetical protein